MMTILKTSKFTKWIQELKDLKGKARIQARIDKLEFGHFGDCESIGSGVFELRIHFGPGYRVYLMKKGQELVILLAGGDKGSQAKDIKQAINLSNELRE
ncbi:type II toxin-antitoxin system RelE/ParE family toxin [Polynucleobacter cosmopolitanus]|jgi:putative addiction module killer protein|uniref:Addiction module antitoxin RelB n=1 Tax=Polynucleobacter cosmopolitanus TaxID=351345 RepID=A0A229FTQ8_9BURK|nr:type II toxin-antitoxin system RelE/ParE family toxin [Polynucleobacter cosmopolitanus]OXL14799.1 addiction module antitoxin RelB [Polynucleobacter cosmopolitanus]